MNSTANESLPLLLILLSVGISLLGYVWLALALAALFRKMGEEGWKGWVPILNIATVLKIGGFNPWLVLLALIPGIGALAVYVLTVISAHHIGRRFGYGPGMTVLAALLFLIWASIIGFGAAHRLPDSAASEPRSRVQAVEPQPAILAAAAGAGVPLWAPPPPPPPLPIAPVPGESFDPMADEAAEAEPDVDESPWSPPTGPAIPVVAETQRSSHEDPEMDEVSAVFPSPFPPSSAAGATAYSRALVDQGPIEFVPGRKPAVPVVPGDAPVTEVPAAPGAPTPPWEPARSTPPWDPDAFPELSGEVSAVVGAPIAGSPRSAGAAVSAQHRDALQSASADDEFADDDIEQTVIGRRRQPAWQLIPASGIPLAVGADVVILGRNPAPDPAYPRAELLAITDDTRTVSKTHARLERRQDRWYITDLHSTNGVIVADSSGSEVELAPGAESAIDDRFLLGDAEMRLLPR